MEGVLFLTCSFFQEKPDGHLSIRQRKPGPLTFHDWVDDFKALQPLRTAFSPKHISDVAKENNEQGVGPLEGRPINHL